MRDLFQLPGPIVVCVAVDSPNGFDDDLFGACVLCGAAVRFRPNVPSPHSLACLLCFLKHADPGDYVCIMTADSLAELAVFAPDVPKC